MATPVGARVRRRWTRAEYDRLIMKGFLDEDDPIELLDGQLVVRAGVADYWILNLVDRGLEVYREPVRSPSAAFGWKYARLERLRTGTVVSPLARPRARIRVADLLP